MYHIRHGLFCFLRKYQLYVLVHARKSRCEIRISSYQRGGLHMRVPNKAEPQTYPVIPADT